MSSTLEETSEVLGRYLLLGWTMGNACDKEDCVGCPVMSKGNTSFCARCDGPPELNSSKRSANPLPAVQPPSIHHSPASSISSLATVSSNSTPASDLSAAPPTQLTPLSVDPVREERRRQSDAASASIGNLLLKGWVLLAEECPNVQCHGIPLMSRPKPRPTNTASSTQTPELASSSKRSRKFTQPASKEGSTGPLIDPRKFCVSCQRDYVDERDQALLAAFEAPSKLSAPAVEPSSAALEVSKGKKRALEEIEQPLSAPKANRAQPPAPASETLLSNQSADYTDAILALQAASSALSRQIQQLSSSVPLNVGGIAEAAEALAKVHRAINEIKM